MKSSTWSSSCSPITIVCIGTLWILTAYSSWGQVAACTQAIPIELSNGVWCSRTGQFSNQNSDLADLSAFCFQGPGFDQWFSFVPTSTDVVINIIGNAGQASGGTLTLPEVALYSGSCSEFQELQCESDVGGRNIVELYKGGLEIGVTHYIQVQARNQNRGSFQICVENFNAPALPGSDCFSAAWLCNTESFSVDNVVGGGTLPDEAANSSCLGGLGGNSESNSTWFAWTASNDGLLEFTLSPNNPADDLDFVLYEIETNGTDCQSKVQQRCMAAGDFIFPSPCMGPTGLRSGNFDTEEAAGCAAGQNNFLAPLQLERGKSYALLVNNFTSTGNGFSVSFGGTATFEGPQADFTTDAPDFSVCVGQPITFTNQSSIPGEQISDWLWSFGSFASLASANTEGPHTVQFNRAGEYPVVLRITNERGCIVTAIKTVRVECCPDHFSVDPLITPTTCPMDSTGAIALTVSNPFNPFSYSWDNGIQAASLSDLPMGDYAVTISDQAGCDTTLTYTVSGPPALDVDTILQAPTCNGGTDGEIELVVSGASSPFEFSFENGSFLPQNSWDNLSVGEYSIRIRDGNGCLWEERIPLRELELVLDPAIAAVQPPSCTGFSNGIIEAVVANGEAPFQFIWQNGIGSRFESRIENLSAGTYQLEVEDANLCRGTFSFELVEPDPIASTIAVIPVSCFQGDDGTLTASPSGGTGTYSFQWNNNPGDSTVTGLTAGTYSLFILDDNNCQFDTTVQVPQPPILEAGILSTSGLVCFGDSNGVISIEGIGGVPPYLFRLDNAPLSPFTQFSGLSPGRYTVVVQDANGCESSTPVTLSEANPFLLNAIEDQEIELGFSVSLNAIPSEFATGFQWSPTDSLSCLDCPNPIASPTQRTTYRVQATNSIGCVAEDSITVFVIKSRPIFAPTSFSPNDDGSNDFFTIYGGVAARQILNLSIYDRWGNRVFKQENLELGREVRGWDGSWKGKDLAPGTYIYVAEILFIDGGIERFQGEVNLLR